MKLPPCDHDECGATECRKTPITNSHLMEWHPVQGWVTSKNGSVVPAWLAREMETKNAEILQSLAESMEMRIDHISQAHAKSRLLDEVKFMVGWIKQAAPLLQHAACIAVDAYRVDEVEGIRAVVELCPVEFTPLPHAGKNCANPDCPVGGDGPCAHCESRMTIG